MKGLITVSVVLLSLGAFSQKSVYFSFSRGLGVDTLTLYENNQYSYFGKGGLVKSMKQTGSWTKSGDTLILYQETPTILNMDTLYFSGDHNPKIDTFLIADDVTLMNITNRFQSYYILIESYQDNSLSRALHWNYTDTVLDGIYIRDYPLLIEEKKY